MSYRTERGSGSEAFVTYVLVIALAIYVAAHAKGTLATIAGLVVAVGLGVPGLVVAVMLLMSFNKLLSNAAKASAESAAQRQRALEYRERQEQEKRDREAREIRQAGRLRVKAEALQAAMRSFMDDKPV